MNDLEMGDAMWAVAQLLELYKKEDGKVDPAYIAYGRVEHYTYSYKYKGEAFGEQKLFIEIVRERFSDYEEVDFKTMIKLIVEYIERENKQKRRDEVAENFLKLMTGFLDRQLLNDQFSKGTFLTEDV